MKAPMKPPRLQKGDTIGIVSPCYAVTPETLAPSVENLRALGFRVKLAKNLFSLADGYAGTVEERASDFNEMLRDDEVRLILFGGGEVCNELLPFLDYETFRKKPKLVCSYSDSTTVLNALNRTSGVVTYYGASVHDFETVSAYNLLSFEARLMRGDLTYTPAQKWKTICPGRCEGVLTGGYLVNYATLWGLPWYPASPYETCILFIEDHEMFNEPSVIAKYFANLEHRGVFQNVTGLLFGHYSERPFPEIDRILRRVGEKFSIPVARCEDFGHGQNSAILPIGVKAVMDADNGTLRFLESSVGD